MISPLTLKGRLHQALMIKLVYLTIIYSHLDKNEVRLKDEDCLYIVHIILNTFVCLLVLCIGGTTYYIS